MAGLPPAPPGPRNVAVDSLGNLFIADYEGARVRRVDASSGTINTVVGGGSGGDGGAATGAVLIYPENVAVDSSGNLFIADTINRRVRQVDASTGIIGTVAGNGTAGSTATGGPATNASVFPVGVAVDTQGNAFIADGYVIHRVDAVTGIITTVAGDGNSGFSGDGGPATSASFNLAQAVAVDAHDNLFIADLNNQRVRRVDGTTGIITTVAGNGGPALRACSLRLQRRWGTGHQRRTRSALGLWHWMRTATFSSQMSSIVASGAWMQ